MLRPEIAPWRRVATPVALAAVSLFAALLLWIAVTDAENPQKVDTFAGGIEVEVVNLPEGLAVRSISPAVVKLRVSADDDVFSQLTTADFRVRIDLTGLRGPTADLLVDADVLTDDRVSIVSISPELVTVTLEPVATKQVPVVPHLVGALPQGFALPSVPEANPGVVQVTGASSLVAQVQAVSADVNLTGLRATLTQDAVLTARDARGIDIPRLLIEPSRVSLRVLVAQLEITVPVPVAAILQGNIAEGYNIVAVTVEPVVVPVSGTLEATQSLSSISTEPLDVSGLKADLSRTVRLRLPAGVHSTRDSVNVRIRIAPAAGELVVNVAPQASGLGDGLSATFQTASIALRLTGDVPVLKALTPGSVRATVSASGLSEGVYVLEPQISVPQGVEVATIDPSQVVLVVRR